MGMSYGPDFQLLLPKIFMYLKDPINGRLWGSEQFKKSLKGTNNIKKEQNSP
jgi:hypothetical protein